MISAYISVHTDEKNAEASSGLSGAEAALKCLETVCCRTARGDTGLQWDTGRD